MYFVNPKNFEQFYLRLLLLHVTGAQSFEDIRTFQNLIYPTFYKVAIARKLITTDEEWDKYLQEAIQIEFPNALCNLFVYICVFHDPVNAKELFNKYKDYFYNSLYPKDISANIALQNINTILSANEYSSNDFNLPEISEYQKNEKTEEDINTSEYIIQRNIFNILSLSNKQREIFNKIMESINNNNYDYNKCLFIDGPGGSGKSYLLNSLITHLNNKNINVLAVS